MKICFPAREPVKNRIPVITQKQILLLIAAVIMFWALTLGGSRRYVVTTAVFAVLFLLIRPKLRLPENLWLLAPSLWIILMGFIAALGEDRVTWYTIQQATLYLIPLFFAFAVQLLCPGREMFFWVDISFLVLGTCVFKFYRAFNWHTFLESDYAFIMGAFAVFYFYFRRYGMSGLAFILTIIANKRSALLGAVLIAFLLFILRYCGKKEQNGLPLHRMETLRRMLFPILFVALFAYVGMCRLGGIRAISELFGINVQGRAAMWMKMSWTYDFSPFWTGTGLGFLGKILRWMDEWGFFRLHNDILVYFIETGAASFGMWILLHAPAWMTKPFHRHSLMIVLLFAYTLLIYSCDNASVYINYLFPLYTMLMALLNDDTALYRPLEDNY